VTKEKGKYINAVVQGDDITQPLNIFLLNTANNLYPITTYLFDQIFLPNNSKASATILDHQYIVFELTNLTAGENATVNIVATNVQSTTGYYLQIYMSHDQPGSPYVYETQNITYSVTLGAVSLQGQITYQGNGKRLFATVLPINMNISFDSIIGIPSNLTSGVTQSSNKLVTPKSDFLLPVILASSGAALVLTLGCFIYLKWRRNKKNDVSNFWVPNSQKAGSYYTKPAASNYGISSNRSYY